MATRWYFSVDTTAKTPAWGGSVFVWDQNQTSALYRKTEIRTSAQSPTNNQYASMVLAETSGDTGYLSGLCQCVTKALAATTLVGGSTFRVQICCWETNAAANDVLVLLVKHYNASDSLVTEIGSAVGGTEFAGTLYVDAENRTCTVTTSGDITINDGDYFVFELGYQANNTKTTSYTGGIHNVFYESSRADLGLNETDVYGDGKNTWLECSQALTFSSGVTNTDRTPTIGAASITGIGPVWGIGVFVPTEVDV